MASLARVYAALKGFMPKGLAAWADDTSKLLKELHAVAVALAASADSVEAILDEAMPDSATTQIDRWEKILRNPTRLADSAVTRRARNLVKLARNGSVTLAQLAVVLAPSFAETTAQVQFIETTRAQIDDALTDTFSPVGVLSMSATPLVLQMGKPWPGGVDDTGVWFYIVSPPFPGLPMATGVVSIKHPDGTTWTVNPTIGGRYYRNRTLFKGKRAGGRWEVSVTDAGGGNLATLYLGVSNDVDAPQIYRFYARRDPAVAGTPDLQEGTRQFTKTARAHLKAVVVERSVAIYNDPRSLCDRDLVGV